MDGTMWSREAAAERREHLEQQQDRERAAARAERRAAEDRFQAEQRRLNGTE